MQHERLLALPWIQVGIARAHGQAIGFADDGAAHNLDWEFKVAHHAADDGKLGGIFLAEERGVRFNDMKQLGDNRGYAAEMARARTAVELFAQAFHGHPGYGAGWIH